MMGNIETGGVLMGSYFAAYIFMAVLQGRKELHRTELPKRILFLLISDILLNCTDDCMTQAVTATLTYKNANEEDEESRKQAYLKECNSFENFHCTQVRRVQYNIHVHMNVDA